MNKKSKWLTLLTILVVIGILSSACAQGTTAPTQEGPVTEPTKEQPPVGEPSAVPEPTAAPEKSQIVVVLAEDPPSFNAAVNQSGFDVLVMELAMLGLADFDEVGNAFPELAAELPTVENGEVVIDEEAGTMDVTWKLRQDVQWSDGTPVPADDMVFTYEAVVDPET